MISMNSARYKRLGGLLLLIAAISVVVFLVLYALSQNINLFYTPSQVAHGEAPLHAHFRVGGLVVAGSVHRDPQGLGVSFDLSDTVSVVHVRYEGILPDLFREGQGIVAEGEMQTADSFVANTVLAKHDENYMPPEVSAAIDKAKLQPLVQSFKKQQKG